MTQWPESLFLLQTLKNSKSLCSLDYEDEDEDDPQAKAAMSSLQDPRSLAACLPHSCNPWALRAQAGAESQVPQSGDSAGAEGAFPLGRGELDLEQIENN